MNATKFADAAGYEAPGHSGMKMLQLQGREAGPSDSLWIGVSHILPGGGTTLEASESEKMYVVLEGVVTIWRCLCRPQPGQRARALRRRDVRSAELRVAQLSRLSL